MGSEGGRKDYSGLVFNARTLTESQICDDIASRDDPGQHRPGPLNVRMDLFVWLKELVFGYLDKAPAT
jgi:hypothetical protein